MVDAANFYQTRTDSETTAKKFARATLNSVSIFPKGECCQSTAVIQNIHGFDPLANLQSVAVHTDVPKPNLGLP